VESLIKLLCLALGIPVEVTASERGRRLEKHCASVCKKMGFQVLDHSNKGKPYDLLVNGHRVQCKARNKHGHNAGGVNIFKNSQKRYSVNEVDFFVIRFQKKCFVIPSRVISDASGLVVSWVRLSNKAHYIDAWHQLSGGSVFVETQMNFLERSPD
jgi:hypothetical protein